MTSSSNDIREIYFEFGRAAEMAQLMELEAGNLALVYATMLVDTSNITDEQREFFQALIQDVNKRTFGNLWEQIQKIGQMDDTIIAAVSEGLDKRNYLMHRFFRKHNIAIHSIEGRRAMLEELCEIQTALNRANIVLSLMTDSLSQLLEKLFGRNILSEQDALTLMAKGKRLDI